MDCYPGQLRLACKTVYSPECLELVERRSMKMALVAVLLVAMAVTLASRGQRPIYEASAQARAYQEEDEYRNGLLALVIESVLCAVAARSSGTPRLVGMLDEWNARQARAPAMPPPTHAKPSASRRQSYFRRSGAAGS